WGRPPSIRSTLPTVLPDLPSRRSPQSTSCGRIRPWPPASLPGRTSATPLQRRCRAASADRSTSSPRPARSSFARRLNPLFTARHLADVLAGPRPGQRLPGRAAVLCAEHLALIARADIDLSGVARMQPDRHDRAVHLHLVESAPSLAGIVAAIEAAVVARSRDNERRGGGVRGPRWDAAVAGEGSSGGKTHGPVFATSRSG